MRAISFMLIPPNAFCMRSSWGFKFQSSDLFILSKLPSYGTEIGFCWYLFLQGTTLTQPLETQRESLAFNYRPIAEVFNLFVKFSSATVVHRFETKHGVKRAVHSNFLSLFLCLVNIFNMKIAAFSFFCPSCQSRVY